MLCMKKADAVPSGIQGWAEKWTPGLVNFVPSVACHLCLNLPGIFSQPGDHFIAQPCGGRSPFTVSRSHRGKWPLTAREVILRFLQKTLGMRGGSRLTKQHSSPSLSPSKSVMNAYWNYWIGV